MSHPPTDATFPLSRREFLRTGAAATVAASVPATAVRAAPTPAATADSCIFLMLTGGPSQLDTFDPKPNAPSDVRGPFRPIRTAVPGLHLSELFPRMAAMADRFSLVRSMYHTAAPIHETGLQMLNTGRLFRDGPDWPSVGCVLRYLSGDWTGTYPRLHYVAPGPHVETGVNVGRGYGPGFLGRRMQETSLTANCADDSMVAWFLKWFPEAVHYGQTVFGQNCAGAVRSVERRPGRFLTVNMYQTVFDAPSWDCHADRGSLATDLDDYREIVAPTFDVAFTALLTDLERRGLLDRTLVVATGEFGRTPHMNANGGRDHWPGCWTAIVAGGGVKGGRVIGASDAIASEPKDRPVTPAELVATIYRAFGIPPDTTIPGPDGRPVRVVEAEPVRELF
jgi:uncharacterized protein (DUF1501 family)